MSQSIKTIKADQNLALWAKQVEECNNSGLSATQWCKSHNLAASTFFYRRQKVWEAFNEAQEFVELPVMAEEKLKGDIAATVYIDGVRTDIYNNIDSDVFNMIYRTLKSC